MSKRVDVEDERVPVLHQAMEYAGAVGTMLLDEMAYVNGRTEEGMGRAMNGIKREATRVEDVVVEHTTLVAEVQGDIETLIAAARMRDREIEGLQDQVTGLNHLVDQLLNRVTALEGRQDNPIEILDSPAPLPVRILVDDAHRLVPIEDLVPDSEGEGEDGVDLDDVFRVMPGEEYVEGETILDVLRRRVLVGDAVPEYEEAPEYTSDN